MEDKKQYIMNRITEHHKEAINLGKPVFATILQGSQNYGLDIYTDEYKSDIDSKCIVLPTFEDFCGNRSPVSYTHIRENNEHIDMKDIRIMFDVFRKQNVNFVEILFSDYYMISDAWVKEFYQLRNMAEDLTHAHPSQTMRTMAGMSMEKRKALCHPYPTLIEKIEKYGYDGKQLSHIIRLTDFMERYAAGESFRECLVPTGKYRDLIMDAKLSKFSLEEALELANEHDRRNREMKDNYIAKYGDVVNTKPYERLDELKTKILKKYFRFEIMKNESERIFYEY
jgi:hypothetical protein